MDSKNILILAALGLVGFGAYKYFTTPPAPPQAGAGATFIPNGQNVNGYLNTSGTPVWVSALGTIFNGAGQILASIPWNQFQNNQQQGPGATQQQGPGATQPNYTPYSPLL
jgi:hypothetical protein